MLLPLSAILRFLGPACLNPALIPLVGRVFIEPTLRRGKPLLALEGAVA
jgi:hypothetical protein